ncbi:MAG: protein kinase domain-containing protein [Anaerolineales bacterium]
MPLEPNALLNNRYRIMGELGRGGMGAVYRAFDETLNQDVALKENLSASPDSERQFRREATLLATLRHPNLPRVVDHFVIPEQGQYLVMDYVAGPNAREVVDEFGGPLEEADVALWAREILDALAYLHSRTPPILHRDIKPSNIKVTPNGKAVLVDFGLAKVQDESQGTTGGARAFTHGFSPPEQYGLGRTDPRSDVYSVGATLYALLTSQNPTDSVERALGKVTLPPIRKLNPNVSAPMAKAVERALQVKPDQRFESAAEFAKALPAPNEPVIEYYEGGPPSAWRRFFTAPVIAAFVIITLLGAVGGLWAGGLLRNIIPIEPPFLVAASATLPPAPTSLESATAPPNVVTRVAAVTQTALAAQGTPTPTNSLSASDAVRVSETPSVSPPTGTLAAPALGGGATGQIAFVSERSGSPQIWVMRVDGSEQKPLTTQAEGTCQPAWSPDGAQLLFVSPCDRKRDAYGDAVIYRMQADGSDIQPLITLPGGVYDPDWSNTGIAFTYLENNRPQIFVASADGSSPVRLSNPVSGERQPSWSPDGARMIFLNRTRSGSPNLYWMNADGTFDGANPKQVTRDLVAASPAWSPASTLVAFESELDVFVVAWDQLGFGARRLTDEGPNDTPAWSPNGEWIAFESWRQDNANHDIYIMTVDGSDETRLTTDEAQDYQPAWRP